METTAVETLGSSTIQENVVAEQNHENAVSEMSNHGDMKSEVAFSTEEVRGTLETSASTGKFWLDWEKLKSILSYHLKQVLSEYPEAKMTSEQQAFSLGVTFQELVNRLDNALHEFNEGPPFTLQRLCEILLSARSIYPKLSKLSLALEKNLLVTSILTISSDPYPLAGTEPNSNGAYGESGNTQQQQPQAISSVEENGLEEPPAVSAAAAVVVEDKDEIMNEVDETEVIDEEMTTVDMETIEEDIIVTLSSSEANPTAAPTIDDS